MTKISGTLLVMKFLEVFHPKRKKSTRAAAADETEKPANILLKSAKKLEICTFSHVFGGGGSKLLPGWCRAHI